MYRSSLTCPAYLFSQALPVRLHLTYARNFEVSRHGRDIVEQCGTAAVLKSFTNVHRDKNKMATSWSARTIGCTKWRKMPHIRIWQARRLAVPF